MNLVILNGSPKKHHSTTAKMIQVIKENFADDTKVYQAVDSSSLEQPALQDMLAADVLLIAFPLYVDSLPMPLIRVLVELEQEAKVVKPLPKVYAVCHCGFYESSQNETALRIIKNFCSRAGLDWQYGLGIGAGVFFGMTDDPSKWPAKTVYDALQKLSADVLSNQGNQAENVFVTPSVPRFIYKAGGNFGWKAQLRKNSAPKPDRNRAEKRDRNSREK